MFSFLRGLSPKKSKTPVDYNTKLTAQLVLQETQQSQQNRGEFLSIMSEKTWDPQEVKGEMRNFIFKDFTANASEFGWLTNKNLEQDRYNINFIGLTDDEKKEFDRNGYIQLREGQIVQIKKQEGANKSAV